MKIREFVAPLENLAPLTYQEDYDNSGWIAGDPDQELRGALLTLDATGPVLDEAISKGCNLVIAHHPVIFRGLKKITGSTWVERVVIRALREGITLYACHTNLDQMAGGVNRVISERLGLRQCRILAPSQGLRKLYTFVPQAHAESLRNALFAAGAGQIGAYGECSFNTEGSGTFKGGPESNPFVGKKGERHREPEIRVEVVFPRHLETRVITALHQVHPYEEPAFDIIPLSNPNPGIGSGMIGELATPLEERDFLGMVREAFSASCIRHSSLRNKPVSRVAVCGGAGSFLLAPALGAGADALVSADFRYHEFFDADNQLIITDIGHYESEQFTVDLFYEVLTRNFPNFAPLKSASAANPVNYFF
ncbi:MAG TPA: Nif3-like dinuclear metal center hexameric protein [Chitinophagaceae bacterium]|nr:Nif3-like dinuclear metal center hexameric protein [Chitinophagaceae bacterium]